MYDEIETEFQNFLLDITNGVFTKNKYLDTWDYEDDYSHKTLNEAQGILYMIDCQVKCNKIREKIF